MPDNRAHAAARYGGAEARWAARAEGARESGAVEAQQLVTIGGAPGIFLGVWGRTDLNCVSAVLEPLDGALGVVDLQYPFDLADRAVLLEPAWFEDDFYYVPTRIFWTQLRN